MQLSQTICLGDIGMFLGTQSIAESNFPVERINKATALFSKMVVQTALGEMLDVEFSEKPERRNEKDVLTIHLLKTARYTCVYPMHLGAILGGADQKLLDIMAKFGEDLGIAFQIQDDILGVFGNEKELGKSVTSDIEEGKNTLLITEAQRKATPDQQAVLDKYYGNGEVSEEGLKAVREIFEQTGSLEYSRTKALEYINRAKLIIPEITDDKNYQQILSELSEFLVNRSK